MAFPYKKLNQFLNVCYLVNKNHHNQQNIANIWAIFEKKLNINLFDVNWMTCLIKDIFHMGSVILCNTFWYSPHYKYWIEWMIIHYYFLWNAFDAHACVVLDDFCSLVTFKLCIYWHNAVIKLRMVFLLIAMFSKVMLVIQYAAWYWLWHGISFYTFWSGQTPAKSKILKLSLRGKKLHQYKTRLKTTDNIKIIYII